MSASLSPPEPPVNTCASLVDLIDTMFCEYSIENIGPMFAVPEETLINYSGKLQDCCPSSCQNCSKH